MPHSITAESIIYGQNRACIQGFGNYDKQHIVGANYPVPDIHQLPEREHSRKKPIITMDDWLYGVYLMKSNNMSGYRTSLDFNGRRQEEVKEWLEKNYNPNNPQGNQRNGLFVGGDLRFANKVIPDAPHMGQQESGVMFKLGTQTTDQVNPFPVKLPTDSFRIK